MKIVQINAVYGEKSTGIIVRDLQNILEKNEIECYVGYQMAQEAVPKGIRIGNKVDWKCHAFYTRITGKQGYASRAATKRFLRELGRIKPDIIQLHNLHANYINLPMLLRYCIQKKINVVITLHDCWFFTGKCFHFSDINCSKYLVGCKKCPKKKMDIPNYFLDNSNRVWQDKQKLYSDLNSLTVVGCSHWISDLAKASPLFSKACVTNIWNGIDVDVFCPEKRDNREKMHLSEKFIVMGMAQKWRLPENKAAAQKIMQWLPANGILLLVGCSDHEINELKSCKNIFAMGYIRNQEHLAAIYAISDLFINLTHADTLPTVNMEATACGTPVVTYDVGGCTELINHGVTGYVVEEWDLDGIISSAEKVLNGSILREDCREFAVKNFNKNKNYLKYIDLYRDVLARSDDR